MEEKKTKTLASPSAPSPYSDLASFSDRVRSRSVKWDDRSDGRLRCNWRRKRMGCVKAIDMATYCRFNRKTIVDRPLKNMIH